MELSNLQVQYQSLQEKLGQQEIVNNNLIHEMLHAGISTFKRRNAEIILTYGLLAVIACWLWYCLDFHLSFMAISLVLFAVIGMFEWFSCHKIQKIGIEGSDLQTLVSKMEKARTRFSLLWAASVLALSLWMILLVSEIGKRVIIDDLGSSVGATSSPTSVVAMVAAVLTLSIILVICNIERLVKMSDELLAQTSQRSGAVTIHAYRHSAAYWNGIAMLTLSLIGLVFRLMHWYGGVITLLLVLPVGILYVILTARHLVRTIPEERVVIRIAEAASLFLVVGVIFKMLHYPFDGLLCLVGLTLIAVAVLVGAVRWRR